MVYGNMSYKSLQIVESTPHLKTIIVERLKFEGWNSFLIPFHNVNGLQIVQSNQKKCPFLHTVETEREAGYLNKLYEFLWTYYEFSQLTKSIEVIRYLEVLTVLELNGLPMLLRYLELLLNALWKNEILKQVSFVKCAIEDKGCKMLLEYLQNAPNFDIITFSGWQLTSKSCKYLARLIKFKQIDGYLDHWPELKQDLKKRRQIKLYGKNELDKSYEYYLLSQLKYDIWHKNEDLKDCDCHKNKNKSTSTEDSSSNSTTIYLENTDKKLKELKNFSDQLTCTIISNLNLQIQTETQISKILERKNKELQRQLNHLRSYPPQKNDFKRHHLQKNPINSSIETNEAGYGSVHALRMTKQYIIQRENYFKKIKEELFPKTSTEKRETIPKNGSDKQRDEI